jgi:hypothetical protein
VEKTEDNSIDLLDFLLACSTMTNEAMSDGYELRSNSLSGSMVITGDISDDDVAFKIYDKYAQKDKYP